MKYDLYKILGVDKAATLAEIKAAYKALAQELHPDRNKDPDAHERMQEIQRAWDILKNADRRAEYDVTGSAEGKKDLKARAVNQLCLYFRTMMQNWDGHSDPINSIRMMGNGDLAAAKSQIGEIKQSRKNLKKLENRFKFNGGGINALQNIVEQARTNMDKGEAATEKQIEHIELTLELLGDYQGIDDLANMLNGPTVTVGGSAAGSYYTTYAGA